MPKPFYDQPELDFNAGAQNLISIVTPDAVDYGLTSAIVTSYTAVANDFKNKLELAIEPATRTRAVVSDKNAAKRALRAATLDVARIITSTPAVTNAQLINLRLNERLSPQSRPLPAAKPVIALLSCDGRLAKFRISNTVEPERRGKPRAVSGIYIFTHVGPTAPDDVTDYVFQGTASRMITEVLFPSSVPNGSTVWVVCCWVNERGQTSQASTPVSFVLQGGSVSMMTATEGEDAVRIAA